MSKAIRVIDLLNKIANGEELPKKVLILDEVYYLINDEGGDTIYSQLKDSRNWEAFIDRKLNITRCLHEDVIILDEVEIIEEQEEINIQSIKEFDRDKAREEIFTYTESNGGKSNLYCFSLFTESCIIPKINELVQAVKQLDKK